MEPYSLIPALLDRPAAHSAITMLSLAAEAKQLRPTIDTVFGLEDFANAYSRMESGAQCGKIVLRID